MLQNVTGVVFETNCEVGRPTGFCQGNNVGGLCADPGPPVNQGSSGLKTKSGLVLSSDFSGTPLMAAVAFSHPFPDVNYAIIISGADARIFTYESKAVDGFVINTNANGALAGEVSWIAVPVGETP